MSLGTHTIIDKDDRPVCRREVKKQDDIYYISYEGDIWIVDFVESRPVFANCRVKTDTYRLNRLAKLI